MGRTLQPLRSCELCEFASRNRYLFKRHVTRCRRNQKLKLFKSSAKSRKPCPPVSKEIMESSSSVEMEETPLVIQDPVNAEMPAEAGEDETSMDADASSLIEGSPMNQSFDDFPEISGTSSSGGILPPPNVCRNYHCQECSFTTTKSKMFLYHQIDVHSANFNVFPCDFCEYASRWKHKLLRHKEKAHKVTVTMEELQPEHAASKPEHAASKPPPVTPPPPPLLPPTPPAAPIAAAVASASSSSPKVKKPSSPARYAASNSSVKLKKSRTHANRNNNLDSCSMYIEKLSPVFNGASLFKCKLCLYTSKTRMQAYKHVYSCHVKAKVFKCKMCSFSTEKKIDFYIHKSKHTNENFYQCRECLYGTTLKTNYDRHMLNHEMTSAFTCNLCSYSSPNEGALKRHLTNHHSNSDENVSLIVSKTSADAVATKTQRESKSLSGSFSGDIGGKLLSATFEEQSGKFEEDQKQIKIKMKVEKEEEEEEDNDGGTNSHLNRFQKSFCYRCRICGLKYKRSPDMNRHMKLKHNISIQEFKKLDLERQYQVLNSVDNDSTEVNFRGSDEDGGPLDLSIKTVRSIFNRTKLKCTYCSYIAKWPCDLRRHMAVHSVDKRYKCHLCMRKYKYFGDLNVHIRRDHDLEPDKSLIEKVTSVQKKKSSPTIFKCPSCSFTSSYKSEIDRHSKLHDGNKPYKCKLCKYQSHWKGDMNRHLYRHHPNQVQQEDDIKNLVVYQKIGNPEFIAFGTPSSSDAATASATVTVEAITPTSIKENATRSMMSTFDEEPDSIEAKSETITGVECHSPRVDDSVINNDDNINNDNNDNDNSGNPIEHDIEDKTNIIPVESIGLDSVSMATVNKDTSTSIVKDETYLKDAVGPFICKYCDFSAPAPSKLKAHLATHLNLKKFKCPICGKRSNWKWDIRKHIRKEHPGEKDDVIVLSEQEAEATVLKYMETMPTNRREHQLNVSMLKPKKLFKCSQCNFQSAFRWTVLKHLRNDHADNSNGRINENPGYEMIENNIIVRDIPDAVVKIEPGTATPPKSSKTISSPSKTSTTPANFVPKPAVLSGSGTPVLSVPMISKLKTSKKDSKSSSDKPYMCPLCGKRTTFRGDVRKHYRYMHPGEEIRILYVGTLSNEEILSRTNEIKMANTATKVKKEKTSPSASESPKMEPSMESAQSSTDATLLLASDKLRETPEHTTALEALYSNPKRVGYIKPFKCSACGRRSNWKWDLKKHIKERHPEDGYVIVMEEEEARQSLLAVCYPNHPLVTKPADSPASSDASVTSETSAAHKNAQKMWRQFECSGCGYKSNWRSDVYRHIKRRHSNNRNKVVCLDHKTDDYPPPYNFKFKKTDGSYEKKTPEKTSPKISSEDMNLPVTAEMASAVLEVSPPSIMETDSVADSVSLLGHGKMWKCNKCSYRHKDKMLVMRHLTTHKVKPYKCKLCGHSSNYRSALYRHLRQKHGRNDYSLCKLSISYSGTSEGTILPGDENNETGIGEVPGLYTCKICRFQSTWKACLYRHLREQHGTTDYNNCFRKTSENGEEIPAPIPIKVPLPERHSDKSNKFQCTVCPYSTKKQTLLKFHLSYHKPRGQNRFKCKYCPYYVCARRLLNQHTRLHAGELAKDKIDSGELDGPAVLGNAEQLSPSSSPRPDISVSPKTAASKRMRYVCEKCPYSTNSKNDFLYHKQFHRVKTANSSLFKCDHCDYWVSHKRLLKQHLRLHSLSDVDSAQSSPEKSDPPDANLTYDAVEIASVKQKLISSKILPTLTQNDAVGSPLKIAAHFATFGDKSGYVCKNGVYKKLLKCPKCPYTNIRMRNLRLHQQMHGMRSTAHPLMKCPHCDYYVGSKGLLSHHLKLHQQKYLPDPNDNAVSELELKEGGVNLESEDLDDKDADISHENRVDALLEIAHFKKFCCERCPYASAKRTHFERHIELHGSKQRYTCDYCDYGVPSNNLLVQHRKLHLRPNPNLVATQSISNLQQLPEIPADLALASVLPPMDPKNFTPLAVTHDHLDLYENTQPEKEDSEPKKLYRCDRCPYSNTRRDHMLTHLKFHIVQSELACPYCDYSVSKNHLLAQHVRVHFCPLPELASWLTENGQKERIEQAKDQVLSEALQIAQLYQQTDKNLITVTNGETSEHLSVENDKNPQINSKLKEQTSLVCQYCDRSFTDAASILKHERQHLIGNQFEYFLLQGLTEQLAPAVATC